MRREKEQEGQEDHGEMNSHRIDIAMTSRTDLLMMIGKMETWK